jgi:hypothetical protein
MRILAVAVAICILLGCDDASQSETSSGHNEDVATGEDQHFWDESRSESFFPPSGNDEWETDLGESSDTTSSSSNTHSRYEALVERVRPGMTETEIAAILGQPDKKTVNDLGKFNPQKRGQRLEIWTWRDSSDDPDSFITLSFTNGVLQDGGTPGYDIRKGFHTTE